MSGRSWWRQRRAHGWWGPFSLTTAHCSLASSSTSFLFIVIFIFIVCVCYYSHAPFQSSFVCLFVLLVLVYNVNLLVPYQFTSYHLRSKLPSPPQQRNKLLSYPTTPISLQRDLSRVCQTGTYFVSVLFELKVCVWSSYVREVSPSTHISPPSYHRTNLWSESFTVVKGWFYCLEQKISVSSPKIKSKNQTSIH